MTDLELYEPRQLATPDPTGGRLVAWASGLAAAHQIGTALCGTSFAPKHFQGKPEEAAAAIMFGDEIGFTPTQALRSIFVINGTPSLYARAMVALVLSRGHEIWTTEDTPSRVTVCGRRRGTTAIEEVTWTTDRARKAGYTTNKKYESDPQAMLYARASGDVARRVAPDVLAGVAYTVEELELDTAPTAPVRRHTPPERPVGRTMKRAAPPAPEEPDLDEKPSPPPLTPNPPETSGPEPPPAPHIDLPGGPAPASPAQMKMLHATFNDAKINDREDRLAYCSGLLGRIIASSAELSKGEASAVIDALRDEINQRREEEPDDNPS